MKFKNQNLSCFPAKYETIMYFKLKKSDVYFRYDFKFSFRLISEHKIEEELTYELFYIFEPRLQTREVK